MRQYQRAHRQPSKVQPLTRTRRFGWTSQSAQLQYPLVGETLYSHRKSHHGDFEEQNSADPFRRQGLHIIDLDSPWSPPRHLAHHTPWEVADVQWSPFAARDYWVVSTSNQKALVWNLAMMNSKASIEHYLHGHSRAITDINFSAHHPDILATCAVDSYVHCWDLRHPSRAAMTFCDWFAGATQVKWNRQDSHILASSHDKFLRIWDDRKGAYPLRSIEAHATKIYGVDWNRTEPNAVATCSLDKTIKLWDYSSDSDKPAKTIKAPFPVWRARHTPFGSGLLAMPQRGDYDLHLYDRREQNESQHNDTMPMVHRFDGHEGEVKEFLWRSRGLVQDSRDSHEFQLVSWGTDRVLRLHRVDEEILAKVGYIRGEQVKRTIPFTRKDAEYRSYRADPSVNSSGLSGLSSTGRSHLEPQDDAGMSGLSMRKQSIGIGGLWASGEYPLGSMAGKKARAREDVDAISWMRGVKIGKRDTSQANMEQSMSSVLSPVLKSGQQWDIFETLAEEITHLADTFSKVTFEDINMQARRIVVSLHGPFGSEKTSVYVRCRMEIPPGYPTREPPWPIVESTAGTNDESIMQASSDLQCIAQAYYERQRYSLEALLRYLLGEQSCEETLELLKASPDQSGLDLDEQTELSSSSDDEGDDQYSKNRTQGLDSSEGTLAVSNAQYNVPLPKACGALWADDGRLVCFFPPKSEKTSSFLNQSIIKAGEWGSKDRKSLFESFGRLQGNASAMSRTTSDVEGSESGDSDYESSRSSSGSASLGDVGMTRLTLMPSMAWRDEPQGTNRAWSVDESQRSSGWARHSKSAVSDSNNFVSIHQCADLLPSKRKLAEEYCLGNTSESSSRNAAVARSIGDLDLADIWDLVDLLLRDEVPLYRMQATFRHEPVLLVARRILSPLRSKDSAIDLTYDSHDEDDELTLKSRIYWGSHPFGRKWLIDALFERYEKMADIQMLAMLSCALQQAPKATISLPGHDRREPSSRQQLVLPESHPLAISERYFPSVDVAWSILRPPAVQPSFSLDMQKSISDPQSVASSLGASNSNPVTPFSSSLTPPTPFKMNRPKHHRSNSQAPISSSPEQVKHLNRSGSNLASAFAASITRPFSFSTPESSSPPTTDPKRRSSPGLSQLATATSTLPWISAAEIGDQNARVASPNPNGSYTSQGHSGSFFETRLKNQDQFHSDGYAAEPLLDPAKEEMYSAYRSMYATPTLCQLCHSTISGLSSPCLNCGHVLHLSCRLLLQQTETSDVNGECPTGCSCTCVNHLVITLPTPAATTQRDPSISSTTLLFDNEQESFGWRDVADDAEAAGDESDAWEDVAYESLARNLGGSRFLTPRASQIWRDGERRKGSLGAASFSKLRRSGSG
ncbi:MAG: hypothetical protein Q9208_003739 [Pyrenodesmia sp. 3 TL-2023]